MITLFDLEGNIIKNYLTQKDASDDLGVSQASVSKALKGHIKHIKGKIIGKSVANFREYCVERGIPFVANCWVIRSTYTGDVIAYTFSAKNAAEVMTLPLLKFCEEHINGEIFEARSATFCRNFTIEDTRVAEL